MRHYLKGSPEPREHFGPRSERKEEEDEGGAYKDSRALVSILIKENPSLSFSFFFHRACIRMCRVSRQLGAFPLHVIKRTNKEERDLVWTKPEKKKV